MARIRTIKPEFFTSEDIVSMSPLARILYVALWCEADREGRMAWKPRTFKMRYLPADDIDIDELCEEILDSGLVELYDDGLAFIPTFRKHQHINPRESESLLPNPDESTTREPRVATREPRDSDVQVGREGREGRERKGGRVASPTPVDNSPPPISFEFREVLDSRAELDPDTVWPNFYHHYPPGKRTLPQWRKWVANEHAPKSNGHTKSGTVPGTPGRDPALLRLEESSKRAVPPSAETRARFDELRKAKLPRLAQ